MTYQHALQYLSQSNGGAQHNLPPDALFARPGKLGQEVVAVYVSHDKLGSATARYLRGVLRRARVGCLHVCFGEDTLPRERYVLDDAPLSPSLLCPEAQAVRTLEISLQRSHPAHKQHGTQVTFSPDLRRAAILLCCAEQSEVRVLILEGNADSPDVEAFGRCIPRLRGLTLVSAGDTLQRAALATIPRSSEVITHAPGGEAYRRLSDACAQSGIRLTLIPASRIERHAVTLGSQLLSYDALHDVCITPGTLLAARAAALAVSAASFLARLGLSIPDEDVARGLSGVFVPHLCAMHAIEPLLLTEQVSHAAEAVSALHDLVELQHVLPRPRRLYVDPALALDKEALPPALFDEVTEGLDTRDDTEKIGTGILLGRADFLQHALATLHK